MIEGYNISTDIVMTHKKKKQTNIIIYFFMCTLFLSVLFFKCTLF